MQLAYLRSDARRNRLTADLHSTGRTEAAEVTYEEAGVRHCA